MRLTFWITWIVVTIKWTTLVGLNQQEFQGIVKDYNEADFEAITNQIEQVDWNLTLDGDVNECWAELKRILQGVVEKSVPYCKHKFNKYKKAIWMTHKAVKIVRRKHNLLKRYRDINDPKYIQAARLARIEIRRAKIKDKF